MRGGMGPAPDRSPGDTADSGRARVAGRGVYREGNWFNRSCVLSA